ncbi:family 43 glycosylhydrolase [Aeromicrobium sp. Root344]|uniref:family 43 glycosylhydrolase n=1 Tax=Aeromicrobium sp. Root344 TaxID=1736521 RepID=UPI00191020AD|nr:family 43 glycosylhydrolase [Aeromicrobium sp. Root344]
MTRVTSACVAVLALLAGLVVGVPMAAHAADVTDGLVLKYDLTQSSGTAVIDSSGNGRNGTLTGGGTWGGVDGLTLDGTDDYVKLPDNVMTGLSSITVSLNVKVAATQSTPYMIWAMGNTTSGGVGNGYLFATSDSYRASIATGNWTTEQTVDKTANLARGVWKTLTYTLGSDNVARLYEDGLEVATKSGVTIDPSAIGGGTTTANYLGKSVYNGDKFLKGTVRDFRVYNRALTASEVASLAPSDADLVAADKAALSLGDLSAVTDNLTLPTKGDRGSAVTWSSSNPAVIANNGTVTRPGPADDPATVMLTATLTRGTASDTKTFQATVLPAEGDQQKADADAAAISIPDVDDVRGNITLPTSGSHGSAIAWASDDASTIDTDGIVHRPAHGADPATVHLSATVTVGSATATRQITATVTPKPDLGPYAGYAFSYFTGAEESIFFAASRGNNALQWDELNGGKATLTSTKGTTGLRDPFLIRSPEGDKFYLIATDLDIDATNWDASQRTGSKYLEVWESTDLVTWSEQRHVKVSPDTAGNTWAPEAYWSDELGSYVVFWASKLYAESDTNHTGSTYQKMLYATTRDFRTFSKPKVWQDFGASRIDSTVLKDGSTYHRFTKDEGGVTGCSDIIQEKSDDLLAVDDASQPGWDINNPAWKIEDSCIGKKAGTSAVEGPTAFKANAGDTSGSKFYLFTDEYGGRGYIPLGTDDINAPDWKVPAGYKLPGSPRHGTVIPVTADELKRLRNDPDPVKANADGEVVHYTFDGTSGTTVKDASGNGYDGTLSGDASWAGGALTLGGTNGHVKLPDNILTGINKVTVSTKVWIDPDQATPYFIWGLGNTDSTGTGSGYLFTGGNDKYRTSIASGNWTTEQTATDDAAAPRGAWKTLTYTLEDGTATIYLDGIKVGEKTGVTLVPGDIGGGRTTANYIGRSVYAADKYLKGKVADFRIYNRALSASEVKELGSDPTAITGVELDSLKVAPIIDAATSTVTLPVKAGTDLTALQPAFDIAPTSTITPEVTGPIDLSSAKTFTVTGANGDTRDWKVRAVEMKSPILPGYNADPNIVRFGDIYYIYATTDGIAGWGSSKFKVWSSKNLVDWTEHGTILDLGPDISWADSNAWAPTATEKDGKFYFYFSAQQNIGVAVSDSPLGPFTDPIGKPLVSKADYNNAQQIDPAVFTDDDGTSYLYWGNGKSYVVPLNPDMTSYDVSKRVELTGLTGFREGMFMTKRAGKYYASWSIDDTGSENYRVGYAIGDSPTGPFTNKGEILTKDPSLGILGTGHHSIVQVPGTDDWYIAYHRFAIPGGDGTHRETTIDRLYFNADGTIKKVVPTLESVDPLTYEGPAPQAEVSHAGTGGWYGQGAALTLTGGSGVKTLQYRIADGAWTTYDAPVTLVAGTYGIDYRAQGDNLMWSDASSLAVKVDLTEPATSAKLDDRTVTLTATDDESGVASVQYQLEGGDWLAYTAPVVVDGAAHTLTYRATDHAGNQGATGSLEIAKAVDPGPGPAPVATTAPVVLGVPRVGALLTAFDGEWDQTGLTFTRRWSRDGAPISGATGRTYRLTGKDAGHRISVQVTVTKTGVTPGTAVSQPTAKVAKASSRTRASLNDTSVRSGTTVTLRATISASGVTPDGKVDISYRGRHIKTLTVRGGKVSSSYRVVKRGLHTFTFSYRGSAGVLSSSDTVRIRVR